MRFSAVVACTLCCAFGDAFLLITAAADSDYLNYCRLHDNLKKAGDSSYDRFHQQCFCLNNWPSLDVF